MSKSIRRRSMQGLSIIELIMTIVILAIALTSIAGIVRLGSMRTGDTMLEARAIALGQAYLDEILGRRFDERSARSGLNPCYGLSTDAGPPDRPCTLEASFGPDTGEGSGTFPRRKFDDVDDYHGWIEGDGEANPIRDAEGDERDEYENFHVGIEVSYAGDAAHWGPLTVTNAKMITVTIKYRGQDEGWLFSSFKGNY